MPAGDGTGPMGTGPMTGRGMGYCTGYGAPGWSNPMRGRQFFGRGRRVGRGGSSGFGRGGGWGWRNQFYATGLPGWARWGTEPMGAYNMPPAAPTREQEVEMLRDEAQWLKGQLEAINGRLDELNQE